MNLEHMTTAEDTAWLKNLYLEAFPEVERKPFGLMLKKRDEGVMDFLILKEGSTCLAMAIMIRFEDLALVDYLAVDAALRGKGMGSALLKELTAHYHHCRLLLEIEDVDVPCENPEERLRRKTFYLKNGFESLGYSVRMLGVPLELMGDHCAVDYSEYHRIFEVLFPGKVAENIWFLQNKNQTEDSVNFENRP